MAILKCPKCGAQYSSYRPMCAYCGWGKNITLKSDQNKNKKNQNDRPVISSQKARTKEIELLFEMWQKTGFIPQEKSIRKQRRKYIGKNLDFFNEKLDSYLKDNKKDISETSVDSVEERNITEETEQIDEQKEITILETEENVQELSKEQNEKEYEEQSSVTALPFESPLTPHGESLIKILIESGESETQIFKTIIALENIYPQIYIKGGMIRGQKSKIQQNIKVAISNLIQALKEKWYDSYPFKWICDCIAKGMDSKLIIRTFNANMEIKPEDFYTYNSKHLTNKDWAEIMESYNFYNNQRNEAIEFLKQQIEEGLKNLTIEKDINFEIACVENEIKILF